MSNPEEPPPCTIEDVLRIIRDMDFPVEKVDSAEAELAALRSDLAALQKERDALVAEHKKAIDELLTMLNTNQARAQSAAQATAKIARELQVYLRDNSNKNPAEAG